MIGALKFVADGAEGRWEKDTGLEKTVVGIDGYARRIPSPITLSYGVESLRKRAGDRDQED